MWSHRNYLTDDNFESCLLLKLNEVISCVRNINCEKQRSVKISKCYRLQVDDCVN